MNPKNTGRILIFSLITFILGISQNSLLMADVTVPAPSGFYTLENDKEVLKTNYPPLRPNGGEEIPIYGPLSFVGRIGDLDSGLKFFQNPEIEENLSWQSHKPVEIKIRIFDELRWKVSFEAVRKIRIFTQALQKGKVRGLYASKPDEYTCQFLAASAYALGEWLENKSLQERHFALPGPWYLLFLTVSPTSMHEYLYDLEMPSATGDILDAQLIPVKITMSKEKSAYRFELTGPEDIFFAFEITEKNEVRVVKE